MFFILLYLGKYKNIIQEYSDKLVYENFEHPFIRNINVESAFINPKGTTTNP
jgi:hypothetical protein